ncbi:MAG: hypothetical protein ACYCTW_05410 [Sulfuricella sp.]
MNEEQNTPTEGYPDNGISHHILPTSATMTGVCVTVISIVRLVKAYHPIVTIIDKLMAFNGLIFLISCFLSYISIRSTHRAGKLERFADILFLLGLSMMAIGGFLLAWEFEHF